MTILRLCIAGLALGPCAIDAVADPSADDYARAERFMFGNQSRYVLNGDVQHHWIGKEDRFWFLHTDANGDKQFVVVDARNGKKGPAFDHARIAAGLAKLSKTKIEAGKLPFSSFWFVEHESAIQFKWNGARATCRIKTGDCVTEPLTSSLRPGEVLSPDGNRAVFLRGPNLWVRSIGSDDSFALTTDGVEHYAYSAALGSSGHAVSDVRHHVPIRPLGIWSPDSRYFLTHRLDERQVKDLFLIESVPEDGSVRPKLYSHRFAMPGDEHVPLQEPVVFDVIARRQMPLATTPVFPAVSTLIERRDAWWSANGKVIYFLRHDRFWKSVALERADPLTGAVHTVLRETSDTTVSQLRGDQAVRVLSNGDVIWQSDREGWSQLYYYDGATGTLRNPITKGEWVVRSIVRVDEPSQRVFFMGSGRERGRDPYQQSLYSVRFDGTGLKLLTPEEAEHDLPFVPAWARTDTPSTEWETNRFSFSGRYFVDSYSRPDTPPVFVLRRSDGQLVTRWEAADISKLKEGGYTPVEPFQVLAADGKTPIYGNLYRPSRFDPTKKYPVIDAIYPLPSVIRTGKSFNAALFSYFEAQSLAELGFVVVTIDGRGTAYRSKAFADYAYGRFDKASDLVDHIAGIRQLAQRYACMDLDRVGIDGASAGGYGAAHAILA
jgi:dipeptidyl aminopeptidase/acylaminoacyl peptidase